LHGRAICWHLRIFTGARSRLKRPRRGDQTGWGTGDTRDLEHDSDLEEGGIDDEPNPLGGAQCLANGFELRGFVSALCRASFVKAFGPRDRESGTGRGR
jgi:hypothetical protein